MPDWPGSSTSPRFHAYQDSPSPASSISDPKTFVKSSVSGILKRFSGPPERPVLFFFVFGVLKMKPQGLFVSLSCSASSFIFFGSKSLEAGLTSSLHSGA